MPSSSHKENAERTNPNPERWHHHLARSGAPGNGRRLCKASSRRSAPSSWTTSAETKRSLAVRRAQFTASANHRGPGGRPRPRRWTRRGRCPHPVAHRRGAGRCRSPGHQPSWPDGEAESGSSIQRGAWPRPFSRRSYPNVNPGPRAERLPHAHCRGIDFTRRVSRF
jgi:hypothetical protein